MFLERLANTWSSGQLAVALSSAVVPEREGWNMPRQAGFVDQLVEFQQGSFFTQQEISPDHEGFVAGHQPITVSEKLSCNPHFQGEIEASLGKDHCGGESSNLKPHLLQGGGGSGVRLEKGPVYVPPHRKVNPGRQRDVNPVRPRDWREKVSRIEQQASVQKHQGYGLKRTVNFNRSLPVGQDHRRGEGEQARNEKVRRDKLGLVDCGRSIRPLMAGCGSREFKSEVEESRCPDKNKSLGKMRPRQQPDEIVGAREQVEEEKSLEQSTSSEKNKSEASSNEMKEENGILERSLCGRKSSAKEKSGSEKKSSGKRKGKSSAKRSQSPEDPPTLSSKSIEAKYNERMNRSNCSSSGYSFDHKQPKPALRLKMPAKMLHRGKAADVCSSKDRCTIGGSCSSLVRTATGIILTWVC